MQCGRERPNEAERKRPNEAEGKRSNEAERKRPNDFGKCELYQLIFAQIIERG